ncbi:hypothetical protein [Pyramidobacter piscolens]|nr:hypothetical protein [Pyramidobacter piscolens]
MGMVKKLVGTALFLSVICLPAHAIRTEYVDAYAAEPATINCLKSSATQTMRMGYNVLDGLVEFDN